eukprot:CAMPEP_0185336562 /NCGR_PEP_ID=MMETSP1363-20130426/90268_1 /TAXON_ID=38817 /ORGANISM="Gephyrocapsa oceanica, Strain RCC1303" /LENGTH=75 /DNA_ID=CAMNT_0027935639 /DNA_START=24 /DNA_END=248 /DNA_ORIENTATION=-
MSKLYPASLPQTVLRWADRVPATASASHNHVVAAHEVRQRHGRTLAHRRRKLSVRRLLLRLHLLRPSVAEGVAGG